MCGVPEAEPSRLFLVWATCLKNTQALRRRFHSSPVHSGTTEGTYLLSKTGTNIINRTKNWDICSTYHGGKVRAKLPASHVRTALGKLRPRKWEGRWGKGDSPSVLSLVPFPSSPVPPLPPSTARGPPLNSPIQTCGGPIATQASLPIAIATQPLVVNM